MLNNCRIPSRIQTPDPVVLSCFSVIQLIQMTSDQIIEPIKVARLTRLRTVYSHPSGVISETDQLQVSNGRKSAFWRLRALPSPQNPTQHGKVGASLLGSELALTGPGPVPCQGKPPRMSKNIVGYATISRTLASVSLKGYRADHTATRSLHGAEDGNYEYHGCSKSWAPPHLSLI